MESRLSDAELEVIKTGQAASILDERAVPVTRDGEGQIHLGPLFSVMKVGAGLDLGGPQASDGWFAPRLHWALRLTRREAADASTWEWLGYRLARVYVEWRWKPKDGGTVANNRYRGGINKQAFARLWWGAELFRNGDDYGPVVRLFRNQDFPNSYIHRAFARNRPLALATVLELDRRAAERGRNPTGQEINDVARNVNLWIAPLSIEAATRHWRSNTKSYLEWIEEAVPKVVPKQDLPIGPRDDRVPEDVISIAQSIAADICDASGL